MPKRASSFSSYSLPRAIQSPVVVSPIYPPGNWHSWCVSTSFSTWPCLCGRWRYRWCRPTVTPAFCRYSNSTVMLPTADLRPRRRHLRVRILPGIRNPSAEAALLVCHSHPTMRSFWNLTFLNQKDHLTLTLTSLWLFATRPLYYFGVDLLANENRGSPSENWVRSS